jgi:hypothetical protein
MFSGVAMLPEETQPPDPEPSAESEETPQSSQRNSDGDKPKDDTY